MNRAAPKHRDDLAHAHALANGDPAAVRVFERRHRPVVRHALGRALRKWRLEAPVEPDDLVQDFVGGFLFGDGGRKLRTYQGRASFSAWIYTVALRWFQRQLARQRLDRRFDGLPSVPDPQRSPEQVAMAAQEAATLRAKVATLSPEDQLYVRLFFVEGLNATEVARTLGKGRSAVRMRKMRILERLRAALSVGAGHE